MGQLFSIAISVSSCLFYLSFNFLFKFIFLALSLYDIESIIYDILNKLERNAVILMILYTLKRNRNATLFQWKIHGVLFKVLEGDNEPSSF